MCQKWYYIYNIEQSDYSERIKEQIQKLDRVGMGAFPPMIMAVFTKESREDLIWDFWMLVKGLISLFSQYLIALPIRKQ